MTHGLFVAMTGFGNSSFLKVLFTVVDGDAEMRELEELGNCGKCVQLKVFVCMEECLVKSLAEIYHNIYDKYTKERKVDDISSSGENSNTFRNFKK